MEEHFEADFEQQGWLDPRFELPRRPERHLQRRPVAPPPLRRPVTLGELIEQLESIAEQLESDELEAKRRKRNRRYSNREAIAQVPGWPTARNCPKPPHPRGVLTELGGRAELGGF